MQKKLIALALASLAGSAFAQSNVTIYGVADVSFEQAKASGAAGAGANRDSFTRVGSNSSYIGFKGVEDLGNGLKAVFQYESGVAFDTAGAMAGGRDTFVGLAGGFGTVVAGTLTGPTRGLGARMDLNSGATGAGANNSIIGKPVGGAGSGTLDTRLTNTIAYVSPNFSGFNAVIGYMSGENRNVSTATSATEVNTKAWDLGLNYTNGPIDVGYARAVVDVGNNDVTTVGVTTTTSSTVLPGTIPGGLIANKWTNDRLAGSYTFGGGHKVVALWDRADVNLNGGNKAKRATWGLGGKFMVTPAGGLIAQYYKTNDLKVNGTKQADSGAKLMEVGYEHSLSKRTIAKASYAILKNEAAAQFDFNVGAVSQAGLVQGAGADPRVLSVGIRHSF